MTVTSYQNSAPGELKSTTSGSHGSKYCDNDTDNETKGLLSLYDTKDEGRHSAKSRSVSVAARTVLVLLLVVGAVAFLGGGSPTSTNNKAAIRGVNNKAEIMTDASLIHNLGDLEQSSSHHRDSNQDDERDQEDSDSHHDSDNNSDNSDNSGGGGMPKPDWNGEGRYDWQKCRESNDPNCWKDEGHRVHSYWSDFGQKMKSFWESFRNFFTGTKTTTEEETTTTTTTTTTTDDAVTKPTGGDDTTTSSSSSSSDVVPSIPPPPDTPPLPSSYNSTVPSV